MARGRSWKSRGRGRGRPGRRSILYVDFFESIILIAGKYDLEPKLLIDAFIEAWNDGTSKIEDLAITRREIKEESASFLITKGENVVAQFPITLEVLKNPDYVKAQIEKLPPSTYAQRKIDEKHKKIGDIRYGMKKINLKAKITEVPPAMYVNTRFGTMAYVSNVKIEDETGSMRLSLWNDQIDKVHVGDEIELENCYIFRYRGEPQLRLGRKGTLSLLNEEDAKAVSEEK